MTAGVGAWKSPRYYGAGMKMPAEPYHEQRVRWAIVAIQRELIRRGFLDQPKNQLGGGFGPNTVTAVKTFQSSVGEVDDGLVGPKTAHHLFLDWFRFYQSVYLIPDNLLFGMCRMESGLDPGAEGAVDDRDRGIAQFNRTYWPTITDEMAFSRPDVCIAQAGKNLREAYDYLGAWDPAIAHHNNPAKARLWAADGHAPDEQIAAYVDSVKANAATL